MSVSPFDAYRLYVAIKMHMTSEYDFTKYCGKVRSITPDAFERRNDKWSFVKLAKMFPDEPSLLLFLASNHLGRSPYIRDLTTGKEFQDCYLTHLKTKESLDYIVEQDLRFLLGIHRNPMELLAVREGNTPWLALYMLRNKIQVETVCVLGTLMGFFPMWKQKVNDTILWPDIYRSITKFCAFVSFDHPSMTARIASVVQQEKQLTNTH